MTETKKEKISAGYFDYKRQSPIYTGDVYREDGAMFPYHEVIHDPEKGFMVKHIGTTEKFSLKDEVKNLFGKTYLCNAYDTPDWDEKLIKEINSDEKADSGENPETTAAETTEKEIIEAQPETGAVSPEATTGTDKTTAGKEENPPVPEVIANTKEEKRLQERRNDYKKHIEVLKQKNDELETDAVRFENLASTLNYQPFVELKTLVSSAVQDYAKKQNIKECEKHLKNYKAIDSTEALLKEYKDLAEKNRNNIELNLKELDDYEAKLAEINDKLQNFQTKLFNSESIEDTPAETKETTGETAAKTADTENNEDIPF